MDEKDLKILEMLQENARMPYIEIARKLGLSEGTVRKRILKMEESGAIKGYSVDIDPKHLGYGTIALLGMDVEPKYFLSAARELSGMECVRWVYTSTGDHSIMAEIWAENTAELDSIVSEKISKIKGVTDLCPAILMEKIK